MKKYVIIGGGIASVAAIEGIRSVDKQGKIVLINGEGIPTYCRPLISYYLENRTDFEKMKYRPDDFYEKMGCDVVYGVAEKIDPVSQNVTVSNKKYKYDELCLATGSTPFVPPFSGLDTVPVRTGFMTEKDAEFLEKSVTEQSNVLIIGAGLIGLKCAEGLCDRVKSITVCDLSDRVLSSILDADSAIYMQRALEGKGVKFYLSSSVSSFDKTTAILNDGTRIDFDVLVTAVGVRANVGLVKDFATINRGVIINTCGRTSFAHVYAAGDCAEGYDSSIDGNRVLAIFPNAYIQGYTAGVNMAGGEATFENALPLNAIGFFGLHALTAGAYVGEMIETKTETTLKRLFIKDGKLCGFMLIGDVERAGILTSLIRNKTPLSEVDWNLLQNFRLLSGLSDEKRRQILGGVV